MVWISLLVQGKFALYLNAHLVCSPNLRLLFSALLCCCSCPSVSHGSQGHYARKLLNDLMEGYSNALRPVEDTDEALNVSLQITLSQIKDMVSRQSQTKT